MNFSIYNRVFYIGPLNVAQSISYGDIGYIIEDYGDGNYEVEFSDSNGMTKALAVISERDLELAEM